MKTQLTLIIFFVCLIVKAQDNPYAFFGYESEVKYETNISSLLTIHNADTTSIHKKIAFDFERKFIYYLNENDSILETDSFEESNIMVWLSVDPLASEYPSLSPYAFVADNPIIYIDPDGRRIVLGEHQDAIKTFNSVITSSFGGNVISKRDKKTGDIKLYDKNGKEILNNAQLSEIEGLSNKQMVNAITLLKLVNDKQTVNLKAIDKEHPLGEGGNNPQTSDITQVGSYFHGAIDVGDILAITQAIEESGKETPIDGVDLILHEALEQYLKQNVQMKGKDITMFNSDNINSLYTQAHNRTKTILNQDGNYTFTQNEENTQWTIKFPEGSKNNTTITINWENNDVQNVIID